MSETIRGSGLYVINIGTICVVNALGYRHKTMPCVFYDLSDIIQKLFHIKIALRQIDQIGALTCHTGQGGGTSQPPCVTAHDLYYIDRGCLVDLRILTQLSTGRGNQFSSRTIARTVVSANQIVVDSLRHADHAAGIFNRLQIFGNFIAGVHRVISANIEEIAHIIFAEDFQDLLVFRAVLRTIS